MAIRISGFRYKSVSLPRHSLYEARPLYIFTQRGSDLAYRRVDSVFGINEDILAPQSLDDFLTVDDLPVSFEQQDKQLHGNALELQRAVIAAQFEARGIQLKFAKLVGGRGHDSQPIGQELYHPPATKASNDS
jgi:hypothetical protein